jgi:type IV pilus assembly protein PilV
MKHSPHRRRQHGFTLIEILVAILIFSFGLLGFVGLQARAIQFSTSADDSNRAALLATDVAAWQSRASDVSDGGLPNGLATATFAPRTVSVQISWTPSTSASTAANSTHVYKTQVTLPDLP